MAIYYRFAHELNRKFENKCVGLPPGAQQMSLGDFRAAVIADHSLKVGKDFDLVITDAEGKGLGADSTMIQKNTQLVLKRVTHGARENIVVSLKTDNPVNVKNEEQEIDPALYEEKIIEVNPALFPSQLRCVICTNPLKDPVLVKCDAAHRCGISVCEGCFTLEKGKRCPNPSCTGMAVDVAPNMTARQLLELLDLDFFYGYKPVA